MNVNTCEEGTTVGTEVNSQHSKCYMHWFVIAGFLFYCVKLPNIKIVYKNIEKNPGCSICDNFQKYFLKMLYLNLKKNTIVLIR